MYICIVIEVNNTQNFTTMTNKKFRISTLNKIANQFELELVKGEGYFYWWGTTEEMQLLCARMFTTSVYVPKLSDMPLEKWVNFELEMIKLSLIEEMAEHLSILTKYEHNSSYYKDLYPSFENLFSFYKKEKNILDNSNDNCIFVG